MARKKLSRLKQKYKFARLLTPQQNETPERCRKLAKNLWKGKPNFQDMETMLTKQTTDNSNNDANKTANSRKPANNSQRTTTATKSNNSNSKKTTRKFHTNEIIL